MSTHIMNMSNSVYNVEVEQTVLGCILLDPFIISNVADFLEASDFIDQRNQIVYGVMKNLYERHVPIDMLIVADEVKRTGLLSELDLPWLFNLPLSIATEHHLVYYAQIVKKYALFRQLQSVGEFITNLAHKALDKEFPDVLQEAEMALSTLTQHAGAQVRSLAHIMDDFYQHAEQLYMEPERPIGTLTGFPILDKLLGGLKRGSLNLLAARPSMGKSALAFSIMHSAFKKSDAKILFFSIEMGTELVAQRLISIETGINLHRLGVGPISSTDLTEVAYAIDTFRKASIWVDDTPGISILEMRRKIKRLANTYGLDLVVVDYLQLMSLSRRTENRVQEVSLISRNLKELAREFNVPILALSQLNREVESRQNKRPIMRDLRDSGALEQDADVIMFIYRDEVYNKDTERPSIADIIVTKHRNGPIGTVELRFVKEQAMFTNIESGIDQPEQATWSHFDDDIMF